MSILTQRLVPISLEEGRAVLAAVYGITGDLVAMTSERDQTFRVEAADGRRFVFKISNPAERPEIIAYQRAAMRHLADADPDLPVPRPLEPRERDDGIVSFRDGTHRIVSLLSFLDGRPLYAAPASAAQAADIGRALGRLDAGFVGFDPNVPDQDGLLWNHARLPALRPLLDHVDPARRGLAAAVLDRFDAEARPIFEALPRQVIHNDFNPHNLLVDGDTGERVTGVIDFGDMVVGPRVQDLAVALAYQIERGGGLDLADALLAGYAEHIAIGDDEAAILPAMVAARMAMTIVIGEWRAGLYPASRDYILRNHPAAVRGLALLAAHPATRLADLARRARDRASDGD
ncbi:phosphotransferase [Segnochrobactrum spirostomi]|uniref:Hydroxylysine kinase n=1 Tax=Segnochrobactrum spirostomi TaxID=2608987 RepID=A0A6A7Y876_9HYPH|nr:phosphotransferase [Segnochrobactrum spirostomi]MQT15554.1 phosphotransferase [Segnochrobactrum spirostomi]